MRLILSFLVVNFLLVSNSVMAETWLINKSEILKNSNKCLKDYQNQLCENLILKMEQMQYFASEQNKLRCQSSILGLQTEIIEAFYFNKRGKSGNGIMPAYVIKNC